MRSCQPNCQQGSVGLTQVCFRESEFEEVNSNKKFIVVYRVAVATTKFSKIWPNSYVKIYSKSRSYTYIYIYSLGIWRLREPHKNKEAWKRRFYYYYYYYYSVGGGVRCKSTINIYIYVLYTHYQRAEPPIISHLVYVVNILWGLNWFFQVSVWACQYILYIYIPFLSLISFV